MNLGWFLGRKIEKLFFFPMSLSVAVGTQQSTFIKFFDKFFLPTFWLPEIWIALERSLSVSPSPVEFPKRLGLLLIYSRRIDSLGR